ncbi:MAG: hypothetical protein CL920_17070 [Deltaproteobacteria bacterium]|nr:hypothetical protein [Deltaproteobacteria bacterium]
MFLLHSQIFNSFWAVGVSKRRHLVYDDSFGFVEQEKFLWRQFLRFLRTGLFGDDRVFTPQRGSDKMVALKMIDVRSLVVMDYIVGEG